MESKKPISVIVVGGSLAGLFAGIVLVRLGHNVTILERSTPSSLLDQGAGINVAPYIPPIIASLNQFGIPSPIFEFFKEYDRTGKPWCISTDEATLQILRRDGGVKAAPSVKGMLLGSTSWELLHNILRANFDGKFENGFIDKAEKKGSDGNAKYLHGMQVNSLVDLGTEGVAIECVDTEGKKTSMTANLVIGADGPSSTMRSLFLPEITRDIVGYVAWRGTATPDLLSASTRESLWDPAFFYSRGNQAVHYAIPGPKGELAKDKLVFNLVWYSNYASPDELADILTDKSGIKHRFTLPHGKMRPEIVSKQRSHASAILPPQLAEVFQKIENPFAQVITDSLTSQSIFMDGKVLLVGDAVAGIRPHATCGAIQAALHALLLKDVFQDKPTMTVEEWGNKTLGWSTGMQKLGVNLGQQGQFGNHPMADNSTP